MTSPFRPPPWKVENELARAASDGQLLAIQTARDKGAKDFNRALWCAADGGHIEAMELIRRLHGEVYDLADPFWALDLDWALSCAAMRGRLEAMKALKDWGAKDFDKALQWAADCGQIQAMHLIRSWGPGGLDLNEALRGSKKDSEAYNLLLRWGAIPPLVEKVEISLCAPGEREGLVIYSEEFQRK